MINNINAFKLESFQTNFSSLSTKEVDTAWKTFKVFLSIIFVVPLLIDGLKIGMKWLVTRIIIGNGISRKQLERQRETIGLPLDSCKRISMTTSDGVKLDGMLYIPKGHAKSSEKFENLLIYLGGQSSFYEYHLENQAARADRLNVPLLVFNPRGVGESTGSPSPEGFAQDVFTAYRYAHDQLGVKPSNVITYGFCLGGAYGIEGAAKVQEAFPNEKINIIADRSFSNLDRLARYHVGYGLIATFACKILKLTGWTLECSDALQKIKGKKVLINVKENGDQIIPEDLSLTHCVKKGDKSVVKVPLNDLDDKDHTRAFTVAENNEIETLMKQIFDH